MKNFKKRTIALVLASVVTVAGSFASERFKNSLMNLSFETSENGALSMIVQTKTNYSGSFKAIKRDANTYLLVLPEFDSKAPTPDLTNSPNIESVNIRTMPYTNNGNGYTRITVKTYNQPTLAVQHRLYIEDQSSASDARRRAEIRLKEEAMARAQLEREQAEQERKRQEQLKKLQDEKEKARKEKLRLEQEQKEREALEKEIAKVKETQENSYTKSTDPKEISSSNGTKKENDEAFLLVLGALLVIFLSIFFYIKAKDKMVELSGESLNVDIKENSKKAKNDKDKKSKNISKIKNTIKTLDSTYAKTSTPRKTNEYTPSPVPKETPKPIEEVNVVDLDALFQEQVQAKKEEQTSKEDDENQALEDFLSGFSFDEEFGALEETNELYNSKLFDEIINGNFKFNSDDIKCINELMLSEIQDETINDLKKYLATNPIKIKSKDKILEDFVTTLAISQNINFTRQDIDALYKLINFEIDPDFVTDLRTNPQRTKEVYEDLKKPKENTRKPSEILSLKMSSELPDLAEALKKQGNRKIESNHKPETVYFSEGYEVSTLSISNDLPDLSKEINNKDAYISKPSAKVELVDTSYETEALTISFDVPDISEAYNEQRNSRDTEEEVVVDEKKLLENINKVQFKPFFDGTQDFEMLNDLDDFYAVEEEIAPTELLSKEEIAAEFQELYSENIVFNSNENDTNVDEIQPIEQNIIEEEPIVKLETTLPEIESTVETNLIKETTTNTKANNISSEKPKRERSKLSEEVLKKIEERREKQTKNKIQPTQIETEKNKTEGKETPKANRICVLDNVSYEILSSVNFLENTGCYLSKDSKGYIVIGFAGNKVFKLKTFESLKSEKIQARINEQLGNGKLRYLVRIGTNKFVVDVDSDNINFVMDLC